MRVWLIALLTLLIQGAFAVVGFLVGVAVVGFQLGYARAWAISVPQPTQPIHEDEDD